MDDHRTPPSEKRPMARRALLAGAAASVAALGAQAILPAGAAKAGGGPVILGATNESDDQQTEIVRAGASTVILAAPDFGVYAQTSHGTGAGVEGSASGTNGKGVRATAGGNNGVAVSAASFGKSGQVAVHADGTFGPGEGYALKAETTNGIALYGSAVGGYALQVKGLAVFNRSGKVTFSTGQASRTITGRSIIPSTLVVATIQGYAAGVWVAGVVLDVAAQSFTIKLNKAAPKALKVGWFMVN